MRNTLYVLVGLPGSGKTTLAKDIANINIKSKHISSDAIRTELFGDENNQENNGLVFEEMKRRTKEYLKEGYSVIYDSTNINHKRRMALLNEFKNIPCKKVCVYFATPIEKCIKNDTNRDRSVGSDVIIRMYKSLHVPAFFEGWNDILIHSNETQRLFVDFNDGITYSNYCDNMLKYASKECIDLAQDNPHHTLSVSRHMYQTFVNLKDETDNAELIMSALLHDIGKPFCKIFKEDSIYANFYGHENVSAQMAVIYLCKCGFSRQMIFSIVQYIQLHMAIMRVGDSKAGLSKLRNKVGNMIFDNLLLLHEADSNAK